MESQLEVMMANQGLEVLLQLHGIHELLLLLAPLSSYLREQTVV